MGIVREPKGVDFIIQSPPLTEEERREISEFIKKRKLEKLTKAKKEKITKTRKTKESV